MMYNLLHELKPHGTASPNERVIFYVKYKKEKQM